MRERRQRRSARCELQEPSTVKRHGVSLRWSRTLRAQNGGSIPAGQAVRKGIQIAIRRIVCSQRALLRPSFSALGVRCRAGTLANKSRFAKNRRGALVFGPLPSLWPILLFLDSS
jgi:hypothetical protein